MSEVPLYEVVPKRSHSDIQIGIYPSLALLCRGTSLIRKRHPLGPYTRTMHRDIWWPSRGGCVFL